MAAYASLDTVAGYSEPRSSTLRNGRIRHGPLAWNMCSGLLVCLVSIAMNSLCCDVLSCVVLCCVVLCCVVLCCVVLHALQLMTY